MGNSFAPIRDVRLIGTDTKKLAASPLLQRREGLSVEPRSHNSTLGDPAVQQLVSCKHLDGLKRLSIYTTEIGPAGMQAIADSPYLNQLETLEFSNSRHSVNPIGECGEILAQSQTLQNLRSLKLFLSEADELTDKSLEAIGSSQTFANACFARRDVARLNARAVNDSCDRANSSCFSRAA